MKVSSKDETKISSPDISIGIGCDERELMSAGKSKEFIFKPNVAKRSSKMERKVALIQVIHKN